MKDEELMKLPRINISDKQNNVLWQEISKDIISPFAPSNKTLLLYLAQKFTFNNKFAPQPAINQAKNMPFLSFHKSKTSIIHRRLKKQKSNSFETLNSNPIELYEGGPMRRKSCNCKLFGLETPFEKKSNNLTYQIKSHLLRNRQISNNSSKSNFRRRNSISITAIVKTSKLIKKVGDFLIK